MRNIAITGKMGSGKTLIASTIINSAGYTKVSFAEPIRNVAALAYGTVDKSAEYTVETLDGADRLVSGRQVLQGVGQAIKSFDNLFWTKALVRSLDGFGDSPVIVDDMRFLHEFEALRDRDWLIVGLLCPDTVRIQRLTAINGREPTPEELNHPSETEVEDIMAAANVIVDSTIDPYYNANRIINAARV